MKQNTKRLYLDLTPEVYERLSQKAKKSGTDRKKAGQIVITKFANSNKEIIFGISEELQTIK